MTNESEFYRAVQASWMTPNKEKKFLRRRAQWNICSDFVGARVVDFELATRTPPEASQQAARYY